MEVQTIWSDDGIAIRWRGTQRLIGVEELPFPDPEEVEDLANGQVASSALFASCSPARTRTGAVPPAPPAGHADTALAAASAGGGAACRRKPLPILFPILVETYRERRPTSRRCARSSKAWPGGTSRSIASRPCASPFASSLLFDYVAAYMYDGDETLAERGRAGAPHART